MADPFIVAEIRTMSSPQAVAENRGLNARRLKCFFVCLFRRPYLQSCTDRIPGKGTEATKSVVMVSAMLAILNGSEDLEGRICA